MTIISHALSNILSQQSRSTPSTRKCLTKIWGDLQSHVGIIRVTGLSLQKTSMIRATSSNKVGCQNSQIQAGTVKHKTVSLSKILNQTITRRMSKYRDCPPFSVNSVAKLIIWRKKPKYTWRQWMKSSETIRWLWPRNKIRQILPSKIFRRC